MSSEDDPPICAMQPTDTASAAGWPVYRCATCGRTRPSRTGKFAPEACGQQANAPHGATAGDLVCIHRGEAITTIPCGVCGMRDKQVSVYACDKLGACTIRRVGRNEAQKVAGKFPATCLGCDERESGGFEVRSA